jgi:glycosyltransferase involved in cell wall biosynthesis
LTSPSDSPTGGTAPRKPAVLMAISNFHPVTGGAERQALLLSRELARRGWRVHVLTHALPGQPRHEIIDNIEVHRRVRGRGFFYLYTITYILSWVWHIIRMRRTYDIVHCHQIYYPIIGAALMKRLWGKAVVVKAVNTGKGGDLARLARQRFGRLTIRLARRAAHIICIARQVERDMAAAGFESRRLHFIPNGVDTRCFAFGSPEDRDSSRLLYVGRFAPQKNLPALLEAFQRLCTNRPDLRLTIIGGGAGREALENLMRPNDKIRERVEILTDVSDLGPHYRRAALFVMASLFEGLSNAMLEAMASGCCVVATAVGGNVDLLDPEGRWETEGKDSPEKYIPTPHGALVRPGDPEALAAALNTMLDDAESRAACGQRARRFIEDHYDIDATVQKIEDLYLQLTH